MDALVKSHILEKMAVTSVNMRLWKMMGAYDVGNFQTAAMFALKFLLETTIQRKIKLLQKWNLNAESAIKIVVAVLQMAMIMN
uniref:Uncharacterized protein n=1 Tax=Acrobeloides nanus TaxID=290746 RepID=A0A914CL34_9BILA